MKATGQWRRAGALKPREGVARGCGGGGGGGGLILDELDGVAGRDHPSCVEKGGQTKCDCKKCKGKVLPLPWVSNP